LKHPRDKEAYEVLLIDQDFKVLHSESEGLGETDFAICNNSRRLTIEARNEIEKR